MKKLEEIAKELGAEILEIGRPVKTVEQATRETGVSKKQAIKSLVIVSESGPLLVIVDGESRVSMSKLEKSSESAGSPGRGKSKSLLAMMSEASLQLAFPLKTAIDPKVLENEYVIGGGGTTERLLRIRPEKIVEYQNAEILDVSE